METRLLRERGFTLREEALRDRSRVEYQGSLNDGVRDVRCVVVCPPSFPFQIPWIIAPDLVLSSGTRHISFRSATICLRLSKPSGWSREEHIVSLLPDAERVLVGQNTGDFGEEHLAPDQDLFDVSRTRTSIIVPADISALPEARSVAAAMHRLTATTFVLNKIGDVGSRERISKASGKSEPVRIYRLREVPISSIREYDNILPTSRKPDPRRMLAQYAVDSNAELDAIPIRAANQRPYFGVVFPYQQNRTFWQFFEVHRFDDPKAVPVYTASSADLGIRIGPTLDVQRLAGKRVIVVGCGALGSTAAVELASAGVGRLVLCDFDKVAIGNIRRHECSLADLGKPKVAAVAEKIGMKNPETEVVVDPTDVYTSKQFQEAVRDADLILVTAGNENLERYINGVTVSAEKPCVYCYVGLDARVGHVVRTIPRQRETGCFACFLQYYYAGAIPQLPKVEDPNSVVVEVSCNNPSLPGAGFDMKSIALAAVRRVIQTIASDSYRDDFADIAVLNLRRVSDSDPFSLLTQRYRLPAVPNCQVCGHAN